MRALLAAALAASGCAATVRLVPAVVVDGSGRVGVQGVVAGSLVLGGDDRALGASFGAGVRRGGGDREHATVLEGGLDWYQYPRTGGLGWRAGARFGGDPTRGPDGTRTLFDLGVAGALYWYVPGKQAQMFGLELRCDAIDTHGACALGPSAELAFPLMTSFRIDG